MAYLKTEKDENVKEHYLISNEDVECRPLFWWFTLGFFKASGKIWKWILEMEQKPGFPNLHPKIWKFFYLQISSASFFDLDTGNSQILTL